MNWQNLKNVAIHKLSDYYGELPKNTPATVLDLGGEAQVYYSYSTIIAVRIWDKLYIRENDWSTTTGRHLNAINPDKSIRLPSAEFEQVLIDIKVKLN